MGGGGEGEGEREMSRDQVTAFRKKLWSLRLIDSVLNMEAVETTVFFALAEGSVAIIKVFGDF